MIFADDQRNAEFVGPVHERLSAGAQDGCQCLEAHGGEGLLADERIICWREIRSAMLVVHSTCPRICGTAVRREGLKNTPPASNQKGEWQLPNGAMKVCHLKPSRH